VQAVARLAVVVIALVLIGLGAYVVLSTRSVTSSQLVLRPPAVDAGLDARVTSDAGADAFAADAPPIVTTGIVFVRSQPIEAEVWVDGEDFGRTPQELTLTLGDHRLELRTSHMGGSSWHRTLHVTAAHPERVDYFWPLPTPDQSRQ